MTDQSCDSISSISNMAVPTSSFSSFVDRQTEHNRSLWYAAEDSFPSQLRQYTSKEKSENEKRISEQLDWYLQAITKNSADIADRRFFADAVGYRLRILGMTVLGLTHDQLSVLENEGLINASIDFYHQAKKFDPSITMEDIFQANRNVWTACYLQVLLGLDVKLSPSIFAYSMLYPVSDNYLDDPRISRDEKVAFNHAFCAFLKGESLLPRNEVERKVLKLVKMIEGQYPRSKYPQVYEGLMAIHSAQDTSMRMAKYPVEPYSVDVLGIAMKKGGTSVLADGILAAGKLNTHQMEAIFNYGAFAQFMDDQEDVENDLKAKDLSVFSEAARSGKLDRTMNRFFAYARMILGCLDSFSNERTKPLIEASLKGIDLLLIDAVVRTERYYSRTYLQKVEIHFPVRFAYIKELRKRIKKMNLTLERVISPLMAAARPKNEKLVPIQVGNLS